MDPKGTFVNHKDPLWIKCLQRSLNDPLWITRSLREWQGPMGSSKSFEGSRGILCGSLGLSENGKDPWGVQRVLRYLGGSFVKQTSLENQALGGGI